MKPWAWHPTEREELLLAAVVGRVDAAAQAYHAWRRAQPLTDIDAGSLRLLPLLMLRPTLWADDAEATPVIRGAYRRAFVHGQMLRARAAQALRLLHAQALPTMLLKGGALLTAYDGNLALRPMNDFDVLVRYADAGTAIDMLLAHGWRASLPRAGLLPRVYHGASFMSEDAMDLDLHWQPLPSATVADDGWIWDAAVPATLADDATRVPCAADLLTIVCAHAMPWSPTSPVRWVADAIRLLHSHAREQGGRGDRDRPGTGFDWERVHASARTWHVTLPLGDTLAYLAARWDVDVPAELLRGLRCSPTSRIDRAAYCGLGRAPSLLDYLARPWRRYRMRSRDRSAFAALPAFVTYLTITLGRRAAAELPGEIARRIARFRRNRKAAGAG